MSDEAKVSSAPSENEIETLVRCFHLGDFIELGFFDHEYDPPRALTSQIKLTRLGARIANQEKGGSVGLHESQLAVFLNGWSGADILIDLEAIDVEALRAHISSEIKRKKIVLPWVYGRRIYDLIADSAFHGHIRPSYDESKSLLADLPQGVFQLGPYVSGPYGLLETKYWRDIPPPYALPGFHCEEIDCHSVHPIYLTSGECNLEKSTEQIRKKLSKKHQRNEEFLDAVTRFLAAKVPPFSWSHNGSLPYFLLDCFTTDEIRLLLTSLLDSTNGSLRRQIRESIDIEVRSAAEFAASLDEAQLLQITLLASDRQIHTCLNRLIRTRGIEIPAGEVRSARIRQDGSGPMDIRLQASALGVRYSPPEGLIQLRLRQLVSAIFAPGDQDSTNRIRWALRRFEGDTAEKKLSVAMSDEPPLSIVRKLIVADEKACTTVLELLDLSPELISNLSDDDICAIISWHIGFDDQSSDEALVHFRRNLSEVQRIARSLPARLDRKDASEIRGDASQLFVSLEEVLKVVLCFTGWALINDHYGQGAEFEYSKGIASQFMDTWLKARRVKVESDAIENMALGDLLTCFSALGNFFAEASRNSDGHKRPVAEWPRTIREVSSPFEFPFQSRIPFLDLEESARDMIAQTLRSVVKGLNSAGVLSVRNGFMHHNEEVPTRDDILRSAAEVDIRVSELVNMGLYPLTFSMYSTDVDMYGRRRVLMRSDGGPEVWLKRPSIVHLSGFPSVGERQVLVVGAVLRTGDEPLRFRAVSDSAYREFWRNFPRRPARRVEHSLSNPLVSFGSTNLI
ncbi:hypothetical protein [Prauserella flavalba]|uniref:hypothetical protein n=1 Tax=Prauserella flavalba TaxID=1477506 RepID=UPI0011B3F971|nr:hypothetical protein [Prauserella flavalba]